MVDNRGAAIYSQYPMSFPKLFSIHDRIWDTHRYLNFQPSSLLSHRTCPKNKHSSRFSNFCHPWISEVSVRQHPQAWHCNGNCVRTFLSAIFPQEKRLSETWVTWFGFSGALGSNLLPWMMAKNQNGSSKIDIREYEKCCMFSSNDTYIEKNTYRSYTT